MILPVLFSLVFSLSVSVSRAEEYQPPRAGEFVPMLDCVDLAALKSGRGTAGSPRLIVESNFEQTRMVLVKGDRIVGRFIIPQSIHQSPFSARFGQKLEYAFTSEVDLSALMVTAEFTTPDGKFDLICSPL